VLGVPCNTVGVSCVTVCVIVIVLLWCKCAVC